MDKIYEILEKAIKEKQEISISYKYGIDGQPIEIPFYPYILGEDLMQYYFVWGFLPNNKYPYKCFLNNIVKVKLTNRKFEVNPKMRYNDADEEEHYVCVEGFNNIFINGGCND